MFEKNLNLMKHFFYVLLLVPSLLWAQPDQLLGEVSLSQFQEPPHADWFTKNYQVYKPSAAIVDMLKATRHNHLQITIYFGTWCGDSKREVPRFVKVLADMGFPLSQVKFVGVSDSTERYKQSPQRQEAGQHVYRVPTMVITEKDKERNRIVEYPAESLERDLLKILKWEPYIPNYYAYPQIAEWLKEGLLADENVNPRGLAGQLFGKVPSASELNACGYVLLADGRKSEAVAVFRVNTVLFPENANCFDSLGEAYAKCGWVDRAILAYERALQLDPTLEQAAAMLKKLKDGQL